MKATLIIVWMLNSYYGGQIDIEIEKVEGIDFGKCLQVVDGLHDKGRFGTEDKKSSHRRPQSRFAYYLSKAYCIPHGK